MSDYITVAEFKAFTQYTSLSGLSDARITDLIDVAESAINYVCGQAFTKEVATTKIISGNNLDILPLPKRLYVLTTLEIDEFDFTTKVDLRYTNQYTRLSYDRRPNVRLRVYVALEQRTGKFFVYGKDNIEILGNWGWESVPNKISLATKFITERIGILYQDTSGDVLKLTSEKLGDYQYKKESPISMPAGAIEDIVSKVVGTPTQMLLNPYLWSPITINISD